MGEAQNKPFRVDFNRKLKVECSARRFRGCKVFDAEFLDTLPDEPLEALHALAIKFRDFHLDAEQGTEAHLFKDYMSGFLAISTYIESHPELEGQFTIPELKHALGSTKGPEAYLFAELGDVKRMWTFVSGILSTSEQEINRRARFENQKKYRVRFGVIDAYEFTQVEFARVKLLNDELRVEINASGAFTDEHKKRVLIRLDKLQAELHIKVTTIDWFILLLVDIGSTLGQVGRDVQPIVKRVQELTEIFGKVYKTIWLMGRMG